MSLYTHTYVPFVTERAHSHPVFSHTHGIQPNIHTESPCSTVVNKAINVPPLEAPIRRIFYLSHEGTHHEHEVNPPTNKQVWVVFVGC